MAFALWAAARGIASEGAAWCGPSGSLRTPAKGGSSITGRVSETAASFGSVRGARVSGRTLSGSRTVIILSSKPGSASRAASR